MAATIHEIAPDVANLLSSAMMQAYGEPSRRYWFYGWEKRAAHWLLDYLDEPERVQISLWTFDFIKLNEDLIRGPTSKPINFNLRDDERKRRESRKKVEMGSL